MEWAWFSRSCPDLHLDAPVRRVAVMDAFVAYQPRLENAILPQVNDLFRTMKELADF